jgi:hypothetical protein
LPAPLDSRALPHPSIDSPWERKRDGWRVELVCTSAMVGWCGVVMMLPCGGVPTYITVSSYPI